MDKQKVDPYRPNPNQPWCPKCEGHTEYEYGGDTAPVDVCTICGWRVFDVKKKNYTSTLNYIIITLVSISTVFAICAIVADHWFPLIVIPMSIPIFYMVYYFKIYQPTQIREKFLAWAKERNYQEN